MEKTDTYCRKTSQDACILIQSLHSLAPAHLFARRNQGSTRAWTMPGHTQLSPTTWGPQDLRLLLVSSCNLQRWLFLKGEEPWPWLYFSYRAAVGSGKFYVQLLLIGWQAQFSIISQEFAAQFMSEEHFQSFCMMMLSSEICSCCYETNLFLPVRQIYSQRPGAAIFRRLFWNNVVFLLLFSSYPFLSFFLWLLTRWTWTGPVLVLICVLFDVSSFLVYTSYWGILA